MCIGNRKGIGGFQFHSDHGIASYVFPHHGHTQSQDNKTGVEQGACAAVKTMKKKESEGKGSDIESITLQSHT
jgi:hypothetical protein